MVRPIYGRLGVRAMSSVSSVQGLLSNPNLLKTQCYVNGQWVSSKSGETFDVNNPATNLAVSSVPEMTVEELQEAIVVAKNAFESFKDTTGRERSDLLRKYADLMMANQSDLGHIITMENGKPLAEGKGEIATCAAYFKWFSEEAPRVYGETIPSQIKGIRIHTVKQPIGVCGIITPWNFPASMIARKVGAALAAGCTSVIKPADATPLSALAMADIAEQAGVPKGVINVVTSRNKVSEFGSTLCESPLVSKISFTGSTRVGKILMGESAATLKKVSFELGGNAPFIVFGDSDVDAAVEGAVLSKFRGSGQTCICANRIYVHESVHDEFVKKFSEKVANFNVGNGLEEGITHGPLTSTQSVDKVHRHVTDALDKNATLHVGGSKLPELGPNFYAPTVLSGVNPEMLVTKEETFGPLAAVTKFSTDDEVIQLANNVEVGLAAYVYTRDVSRVHKVTEGLQVGMVGVNTGLITEASMPFGGVKESGFGREGSLYGLEDYLSIKSVITKL